MAQNVFSMNPVDWATQAPMGAKPETQQQKSNPLQAFGEVAKRHGVGVNTLLALESEAGGDFTDLEAAVKRAVARAARLSELRQGGAEPRDALRAYLDGDPDRARAVGHLANQITRDLAPEKAQDRSTAGEAGSRFARGITAIPAGALEGKAIGDAERERVSRQAAEGGLATFFQSQLEQMQATLQSGELTPQQREALQRDIAVTQEKLDQTLDYANSEVANPEDSALFKAGQEIRWDSEGVFGTPDPSRDGFGMSLAEGAGNMVGFVATAIAGTVAGGGVGGFAATGYAGAQLNKSDVYKEARAAGLDVEQATSASNLAEMLGATEAIPIMSALRVLPAPLRRQITNKLAKRLAEVAINAGEEAAQEAIVGIGNNLIARDYYDPERDVLEGVGEQALIGAILGGAVNVGAQGYDMVAGRGAPFREDETPGADGTAPGTGPAGSPEAGAGEGPVGPTIGPEGAPVQEPPRGPLERSAQDAPAAQPEQQEAGPYEPLYPDLKPGEAVPITDLDGTKYDATFLGEKADPETGETLVDVRVGGQRFTMTPQEFEAARSVQEEGERQKQATDTVTPSMTEDERQAAIGGAYSGIEMRLKEMTGVTPNDATRRQIERQVASIVDSGFTNQQDEIDAYEAIVQEWAPTLSGQPSAEVQEPAGAPATEEPAPKGKKEDLKPSAKPGEPLQLEGPPGDVITKRDGQPFGDQKAAARAMMKQGLGQNEFYIAPVEGGFVIRRKPQEEGEPQNDAATADAADDVDGSPRADGAADQEQDNEDKLDEDFDAVFGTEEATDQGEEGTNEGAQGGAVATGQEEDAQRRSAVGKAKRKLKEAVMAREKRLSEPDATPDDVTRMGKPVREARDQLASLIGDEAADSYWANLDQAGADRFPSVQLPETTDNRNTATPPEGWIAKAVRGIRKAGSILDNQRQLSDVEEANDFMVLAAGGMKNGRWKYTVRIDRKGGEWRLFPGTSAKAIEEVTAAFPEVFGNATQNPTAEEVDQAAQETDPNPTDAQKEAENYKTGKIQWQGLTLSIENRKGSERSGIGPDGQEWSVTMPAHYGRILRTEGADGDHLDFYMGEYPEAEKVWIIDQMDAETGLFDEHKAMLGFKSKRAALKTHREAFSDDKGKERQGGSAEMTVAEFKDWLENGDQKQPVSQKKKKREKIDDFGEKIGGSRKEKAAQYRDTFLDQDVTTEDIRGMTLTQAFPIPDYAALEAAGHDPERLAALSLVRGALKRKPVDSWRTYDWAEDVGRARGMAAELLNPESTEDWMSVLESSHLVWDAYYPLVPLMADKKVPRDLFKYAGEVQVGYAVMDGAKRYVITNRKKYVSQHLVNAGNHEVFVEWEIKDADPRAVDATIAALKAERDKAKRGPVGEKKFKLQVRGYNMGRQNSRAAIYVTGPIRKLYPEGSEMFEPKSVKQEDGSFTHLSGAKQASDFLKENEEMLLDLAREKWAGPNERNTEARDRKGPPRRKGDVTPEMFTSELGFRGVTFGNNLTADERQERMNLTYDAMMDLAGAIGVPVKTLSLDGRLGLGFGSHGKGGRGHWAAVYFASTNPEEDQVIALTKNQGAGSLAHEWFHAIDNFMHREDNGGKLGFITERARPGNLTEEQYRPFADLRGILQKSDHRLRMAQVDKFQNKKPPYWSSTVEMAARAFERMVVDRLYTRDMRNDFLANPDLGSGAYMTPKEIRRAGVAEAFDAVLDVVRDRLNIEGGTVPDMPDVIEDRVNKAPGVGFQWESPEGWRELTGYKAGTKDTDQFEITDKATGKQRWVLANTVEDIIEGDALRMTPEYQEQQRQEQEQREAEEADQKAANEIANKRNAVIRAVKEKTPSLLDAFARATGKKSETVHGRIGDGGKFYRWSQFSGYRAEKIVFDIERGEGYQKLRYGDRHVVGGFGEDIHTKLGMQFAEWYQREWDRQEAARQAAEAANQAEPEAPVSDDPEDKLDEDFEAVFGSDGFSSMAELARYIEDNAPAGYMLQVSGENTPAILRDPDLKEVRRYPGIPQKADVDRHIAQLGAPQGDWKKKFGYTTDNPGGEWLANKKRNAAEEMATGKTPSSKSGIRGSITATLGMMKDDMFLPVAWLRGLPAMSGENRRPGDPKYDSLRQSVEDGGFDPLQRGNKVVVAVNHEGKGFLMEGNTRVAVAFDTGVDTVRAEVRYWNGGEEVDGPVSPEKVASIGKTFDEAVGNEQTENPDVARDPDRTAGEAGASAVKNIAEGGKEAAEALWKLFGGDDPTTLSAGLIFNRETYEKAKPHLIAAARAFAKAGDDIIDIFRAIRRSWIETYGDEKKADQVARNMREYIKQFARDIQSGEIDPWAEENVQNVQNGQNVQNDDAEKVTQGFLKAFEDGESFGTIVQARKKAGDIIGRKIEEGDYLWVEEAIESAVVRRARELVASSSAPRVKMMALTDLYQQQPRLNERTPDKMIHQAYSTPAPLAYVASRLAGIGSETRVYEPTAGNGMLLMEATPGLSQANELQQTRAAQLGRNIPGVVLTSADATGHKAQPFDVLIANPPFGPVKDENGVNKKWPLGEGKTSQIDHAISWAALEQMPEDGRAVLIVGSVKKQLTGDARVKAYREQAKSRFYKNLYDTYNVVDHFTVAGELYSRQGAAWPVDVIVIDGKGASSRDYPMKTPPEVLSTWDEVGGKLNDAPDVDTTGRGSDLRSPDVQRPDDAGAVQGEAGGQAGSGDRGGEPGGRAGTGDAGIVGGDRPSDGRPGATGGRDDGGPRSSGVEADGDADGQVAGQPGSGNADGRPGDGAQDADGAPDAAPRERVKRENTEAETEYQVKYEPRSNVPFAVGTLVPNGMRDAINDAMAAIEAEHGDIDLYVARELGYKPDELNDKFSAEQVDALAMAISQIGSGNGFIIGDQTGVGKGRVVAGMLRYAKKKGLIPVFVTEKDGLYGDMIRDLRDIGELPKDGGSERIMVTNEDGKMGKLEIGGPDDLFKYDGPAKTKSAIGQLRRTKKLPKGKDYLFTTYNQIQYLGEKRGGWPVRVRMMRDIASRAMFVMDESHNAGGSSQDKGGRYLAEGEEDTTRATLFRQLIDASDNRVFYSSATYAKNPNVMDLYRATNLRLGVEKIEDLADAINKGGVPLQQIIANALTSEGQYIRRERSFDGVSINQVQLETNQAQTYEIAAALAEMARFDIETMEGVRQTAKDFVEADGEIVTKDGAVGVTGTSSANFTSTAHNLINQFLLSVKLEPAVEKAVEAWKAGEKPVLTLMNTNEAILKEEADDAGAIAGQPFDLPLKTLMKRYLRRLRQFKIKLDSVETPFIVKYINDDDMGAAALAEYEELEAKIDALPDGLSGAPIDVLLDRMRAAGMKVDEISGRSMTLTNGVLQNRRSGSAENKSIMNAFNRGDLDAIILTASGSTGFSLHAMDAKGNDGKKRRMMVLQPHHDITRVIQTFGRVHRTGQSQVPEYDLIASDLAIEKRPMAVLMKKLGSLNANTTAGKRSAFTMESVVDFVNEVGDGVVREYLKEDEYLTMRLGLMKETRDKEAGSSEGLAQKMTGRLAFVPPDEAALHFDAIEQAYTAKIQELDDQGINPLEAKNLDFDAKTLNSWVIEEGGGSGSALDGNLVVEQVSVKKQGQPYRADKVRELVEKKLYGKTPQQFMQGVEIKLREQLPEYLKSLEALVEKRDAEIQPLEEKYETARKDAAEARQFLDGIEARALTEGWEREDKRVLSAKKTSAQAERHLNKTSTELNKARAAAQSARDQIEAKKGQFEEVWAALRDYAPGSSHNIATDADTDMVGVVIDVDISKTNGSPVAANRIMVRFAVADAQREMNVPLSRIINRTGLTVEPTYAGFDPYPFFDAGQSESRETRFIATGNLLRAFARFDNVKGQAVFYTTSTGEIRTGMLMPAKFDLKKELSDQDVSFPEISDAVRFISENAGILKDAAKVVQIHHESSDQFRITTPVKQGRAFFLLQAVQPYIENFRAKGKNYVGTIRGRDNLSAALQAYSDNLGATWVTDSFKDEARAILGIDIPDPETAPRERRARETGRVPSHGELIDALNSVMRAMDIPASRLTLLADGDVYVDDRKVMGWYDRAGKVGVIKIALNGDPTTTLNHEVIHFLRDPKVWGTEYGIFTRKEWRTLVKAAQANTRIMREVKRLYPELPRAIQLEEAVAEMYAIYRRGETVRGAQRVLAKIGKFFHALGAALRGIDIRESRQLMDAIAEGRMRSRYRDDKGRFSAEKVSRPRERRQFPTGTSHWRQGGEFFSDLLTDAMSGQAGLLSLVPGRALFTELGKRLPAAQVYQRLKEEMDALRNEWHARTDKIVQKWMKLRTKNTEANERLMDLMHRSTLAGIDPSQPLRRDPQVDAAYNFVDRYGEDHPAAGWALRAISAYEQQREAYDILRAEWDQLPPEFQRMYRTLLREYSDMGDAFEDAIAENIRNATRIAAKRAERAYEREMERIADEGLTGAARDDAIQSAERKRQQAQARAGWATNAKIGALRQKFEQNKLKGPYFPLARFGDYYVTARDPDGKVVSFSLFEKAGQQRRAIQRLRREYPDHEISHGVMSERKDLSSDVDPEFVADVQQLLGDANADPALMDAVWQRWLETLPDFSIRTNRIHRKGREGFSQDAMRAYTSHMFHGAHQLARLHYGLKMTDSLDDAERQAEQSDKPERNMKAVNEMRKRHEFAMSPTGSPLAAGATSLAFVWYLGATPAAGIVNLTQTTVVGIPVMKAGFQNHSVTKISSELFRAAQDFLRDPNPESYAATLTDDEKAAMQEAYRRGTISKTQAHELAQVAETGIEYSGFREKWMRRISWFFHHAERANREITFLASYRLARQSGLGSTAAINKAADLTWKTHFDYQNTARPRIMQNDWMKVLTVFRQFTVNMLWRLFRDSHQALRGATAAERREARVQLTGITLSMAAHAGITGVWGWGLLMTLMSIFFPGDDDDMEARIQDAVLMEGDSAGVAAWNYIMGMALKGIPGHVAGANLSERIGMPDLWFRGANRDLEGSDLYNHWVGELLGPVAGIGESFFRGASYALGGEWWRGFEAATPKFINDISQAVRYGTQGVTTLSGEPIVENVTPYQAIMQGLGFTPAQVAERYAANSRMMNAEKRILRERSSITRDAWNYVKDGKAIPQKVLDRLYEFNRAYPEYPITRETMNRSFSSRASRSARGEFGIVLNPKLAPRIREGAGQLLYE